MTSPNLNVDHEQLLQLANGQEVLIDTLTSGTGPPQIRVEGQWPSAAAAEAVLGAARVSKAAKVAQLGAGAEGLRANGEALGKQDIANAVKLGDVAQLIGTMTQPIGGIVGQTIGAAGGLTGALSEAATYPVSGLIGALGAAGINTSKPGDHAPTHNSPGSILTPEYHPDGEASSGAGAGGPSPHTGHHVGETREQAR